MLTLGQAPQKLERYSLVCPDHSPIGKYYCLQVTDRETEAQVK